MILAAVAVVLLRSGTAAAQGGPLREHRGWFTKPGVWGGFEIVDRAKAERRLRNLEAKVERDAARGDSAAVDRDAYRIHETRHRIAVDQWLTRKILCDEVGPYPDPLCVDGPTRAAIDQYRRPHLAP